MNKTKHTISKTKSKHQSIKLEHSERYKKFKIFQNSIQNILNHPLLPKNDFWMLIIKKEIIKYKSDIQNNPIYHSFLNSESEYQVEEIQLLSQYPIDINTLSNNTMSLISKLLELDKTKNFNQLNLIQRSTIISPKSNIQTILKHEFVTIRHQFEQTFHSLLINDIEKFPNNYAYIFSRFLNPLQSSIERKLDKTTNTMITTLHWNNWKTLPNTERIYLISFCRKIIEHLFENYGFIYTNLLGLTQRDLYYIDIIDILFLYQYLYQWSHLDISNSSDKKKIYEQWIIYIQSEIFPFLIGKWKTKINGFDEFEIEK